MSVSGADQLRVLAARCKAVGSTALLNAARAELRAEAQPLISAMRAKAESTLPRSGGLNQYVAAQRWTVSTRTGLRTAGVRLYTRVPATQQTNGGEVRHPTFGRRGKGDWVTQSLPTAKGWATDTAASRGPAVAARMAKVLNKAVVASLGVTP